MVGPLRWEWTVNQLAPVLSDRGHIIIHHRLGLCNAVELHVNRGQLNEKSHI